MKELKELGTGIGTGVNDAVALVKDNLSFQTVLGVVSNAGTYQAATTGLNKDFLSESRNLATVDEVDEVLETVEIIEMEDKVTERLTEYVAMGTLAGAVLAGRLSGQTENA